MMLCTRGVAGETPANIPLLPHAKFPNEDWYGAKAKRLGIEGRVLVAFDVTAKGAAKNISILWSENDLLAAQTTRFLSAVRFDVPRDWQTTGALRRWRLGFVYRLSPSGQPQPSRQSDEFAIPVEIIGITGSRLRSPRSGPLAR